MTNTLVTDGDSITAGFGTMTSYSQQLPIFPNWTITDVAVISETLQTMLANAPANVDPLIGPTTPGNTNIVVVWGGTNDFYLNDASVSTVYGYLQSYCVARRAAGWKVIVVPMISRTGNTQNGAHVMDNLKTAYNALIDANWQSFADAKVSLPATLTANGAYASTLYFQDGVHPTQFSVNTIVSPQGALQINQLNNVSISYTQLSFDNFNRANANPVSGNWTTISGHSAMQLVSNAMEASTAGALNGSYNTGSAWPNDQYAEFSVPSAPGASSDSFGPGVRIATGVNSSYSFLYHPPNGTQDPNAVIFKTVNGAFTSLVVFPITVANGDVLRFEVQSNRLVAYQNGFPVKAFQDSALTSGSVGVNSFLAGGRPPSDFIIDNWDGGSITISTVYFIAGNVGLAGAEAIISYSGAASGTVTADAYGNYIIPNLPAGNYVVTPSLAGRFFTPSSLHKSVSANVNGANFSSSSHPNYASLGENFRYTF